MFYDNIAEYGQYGITGDGQAPGLDSVSTYTTDYDFDNNVLIGAETQTEDSMYHGFLYASNNQAIGFKGGSQLSDVADFRLATSSPYKNAATDGQDLGADIDAILAAISGQPTGAQVSLNGTTVEVFGTAEDININTSVAASFNSAFISELSITSPFSDVRRHEDLAPARPVELATSAIVVDSGPTKPDGVILPVLQKSYDHDTI